MDISTRRREHEDSRIHHFISDNSLSLRAFRLKPFGGLHSEYMERMSTNNSIKLHTAYVILWITTYVSRYRVANRHTRPVVVHVNPNWTRCCFVCWIRCWKCVPREFRIRILNEIDRTSNTEYSVNFPFRFSVRILNACYSCAINAYDYKQKKNFTPELLYALRPFRL